MFGFYRQIAAIVLASFATNGFAQILQIDAKSVEAKAWVIYDPQSHQIIAASEENQRRAPASLTKLMVGYLAMQALKDGRIKLEQVVTVPEVVTTVQTDESRMHLKAGEQVTVQDLVSGLIIMSANDAALTLATLIAGDIPHFLVLMNQTAQQLHMQQTHFSNPSGITMDTHYSSALDIALLSQAIIEHTPEYLNYSKLPEFAYKSIHHHATNILLTKDPSVDGLKTGYTAAAGYNLALTANRLDPNTNEARRLIVVVLGTASKQKRADVAEQLMNIAFNYTQTRKLFVHSQKIADIPIISGKSPMYRVLVPASQSYNTLSLLPTDQILNTQQFDNNAQRFMIHTDHQQQLEPLKQPKTMSYSIQLLKQQLQAPMVEQNLPIAKIQVLQFQRPISTVEVVQDIHLPEANWFERFMAWLKGWVYKIQGHAIEAVIYPIE